jgi:hypothetical protein
MQKEKLCFRIISWYSSLSRDSVVNYIGYLRYRIKPSSWILNGKSEIQDEGRYNLNTCINLM